MGPIATVAQQRIVGLTLGCALLAAACGGQGSSQQPPGTGGAGMGGVSGTGGTSSVQPDAAMVGGSGGAQDTGGTTGTAVPDAARPGSGGRAGTGGSSAGGAGGTRIGSGGATAASGGSAGRPATGGRSGIGGSPATGGRAGSGGAAGGGATGARTGGAGGGGGASGGMTGTSTTAVPSEGCGKPPPADGRQNIDVGGTSREFILKIPDDYDNNHPYRLIFGFHGAKYNDDWVATGVAGASGTNLSGPWFGLEAASSGSAIFVAPQASGSGWGENDLPFVDAMVKQFEAELCIDKSRIFSTGFSMGAIMTLTLGCNRADVFRGIAPMSGRLPTSCPNTQPLAYWSSHGTSDTTIRPADGEAARDAYVKRNHCTSQTSTPNDNNCVTYQGCDAGYPVTWCTFPGVHDPAPFAGPEIWSFLAPL